jgi:3-oxo-5-alpha-steroid 4-dehydrogenase 1
MQKEQLSLLLSPYWMLLMAIPVFFYLQRVQAPYAKFSTASTHRFWGPTVPARWAWVIQETPSLLCVLYVFLTYGQKAQQRSSGNVLLLALFCFHYVCRALIFPFLIRGSKPCPFFVMLLSFAFCVFNGSMQGYALGNSVAPFSISSLSALQLCGIALFAAGFLLNQQADHILRSLRSKPADTSHYIPHGGLFEFVTAANYSAELMEWCGWSLSCQSLASVAFAVFTFANLAPRAVAYHDWYLQKFDNYPKQRMAIIPFLY